MAVYLVKLRRAYRRRGFPFSTLLGGGAQSEEQMLRGVRGGQITATPQSLYVPYALQSA